MTFQQLQYILEIYKTQSFSQAALNLYVTQSSISRAVNALEQELGVKIFHRKWNGVLPTEQGLLVLEEARQILASCRRMTVGSERRSREIRLSFPRIPQLTNAFVRFQQEYKGEEGVRISQVEIEEEQVLERLAMFEADLCIISPFSDMVRSWMQWSWERHMDCVRIGAIPAVIRIAPAHPLYSRETLTPGDFRDETILDRGRLSVDTLLKPFLDVDRRRMILTERYEVRDRLRAAGLGYTVDCAIYEPSQDREIPLGLSYELLAITNSQRVVSPEVQRFLELAEEELGVRCGRSALSAPGKKEAVTGMGTAVREEKTIPRQ